MSGTKSERATAEEDKRKKSDQVRLAIGDPTAPYGRDKMKVFRPLYNVCQGDD